MAIYIYIELEKLNKKTNNSIKIKLQSVRIGEVE